MTVLNVRHITTYEYSRAVGFGEHRILSRPRDSYDQRLLQFALAITPEPSDVHWIHDVFGNCVAVARFRDKAKTLVVESTIVLDHTPYHGPRFRAGRRAKTWPVEYDPETTADLLPYVARHYPDEGQVQDWAARFLNTGRRTDAGQLLATMTYAIQQDFQYARRTEAGTQAPWVTLASRLGSCRDFALLMIEACRSLGLAARFVTGYIYVASRDGPAVRGGGSTHAWVQVFLPGAGWLEFDPTNGIVGNRDLIRVGVARDPVQAIPLWGTFSGNREDVIGMTVQVNVTTAGADLKPAVLAAT